LLSLWGQPLKKGRDLSKALYRPSIEYIVANRVVIERFGDLAAAAERVPAG
jgi:hypothetical protein